MNTKLEIISAEGKRLDLLEVTKKYSEDYLRITKGKNYKGIVCPTKSVKVAIETINGWLNMLSPSKEYEGATVKLIKEKKSQLNPPYF